MGLDGILAITAVPFAQPEPQGTLLRILHNLPCEHLVTFMGEKPPKGNKPPVSMTPIGITQSHLAFSNSFKNV